MSVLVYGGLILFALLLQTTVFSVWPFLRAAPDMILVLVVIFSLLNGPSFGVKFGFMAGLALDLLIGEMIGLNAITKAVIGLSVGFGSRRFYKENYFIPFLSVIVGSIIDQLLYLLFMMIFGLSVPWSMAFRQVILPMSIYNGGLSLLIYLRLYYLSIKIAYWDELVKRTG